MPTINLKKIGGMVKIEVNGAVKAYRNIAETSIYFDVDGSGAESIIIGSTGYAVSGITQISFNGVACIDAPGHGEQLTNADMSIYENDINISTQSLDDALFKRPIEISPYL